jgi:hypothetical protein
MTDPIALAAPTAQSAAPSTAQSAPPAALEPAETRLFATLMQGMPAASPSGGSSSAFSDVAASLSAQFGKTRSFEDIRRSMLTSFDVHDPIKSMWMVTSSGMEAQMLFAKLHLSTSLATAAVSVFGNLLKNQQ